MKTKDLIGPALDWAVAKCEGASDHLLHIEYISHYRRGALNKFSTDWSRGGPIIEREKIELIPPIDEDDDEWMTCWYRVCDIAEAGIQVGPTPLIAAMRCYVASKLGDEIEIPEELK